MYCVVNHSKGEYYIGDFRSVINSVYKYYVFEDTLYYKTKYHEKESHIIKLDFLTNDQMYTVICNYLWNQLERFDYIRFRQVTSN
jgi:hypothetical protein